MLATWNALSPCLLPFPMPWHICTTKVSWQSLKATVFRTAQHTSMKVSGFQQLRRQKQSHLKKEERKAEIYIRATDRSKEAILYRQCRHLVFYVHTRALEEFTQKAANNHSKPNSTEQHVQCKRRIIFTPIENKDSTSSARACETLHTVRPSTMLKVQ